MGKVLELGKINEATINAWPAQFEVKEDTFYCKKCGSKIVVAPCYISLHLKIFDPACAGPGKVFNTIYPYCPKCDGDIDYVRACIHLGTDLKTLIAESIDR